MKKYILIAVAIVLVGTVLVTTKYKATETEVITEVEKIEESIEVEEIEEPELIEEEPTEPELNFDDMDIWGDLSTIVEQGILDETNEDDIILLIADYIETNAIPLEVLQATVITNLEQSESEASLTKTMTAVELYTLLYTELLSYHTEATATAQAAAVETQAVEEVYVAPTPAVVETPVVVETPAASTNKSDASSIFGGSSLNVTSEQLQAEQANMTDQGMKIEFN